jgi:hypothetical protein
MGLPGFEKIRCQIIANHRGFCGVLLFITTGGFKKTGLGIFPFYSTLPTTASVFYMIIAFFISEITNEKSCLWHCALHAIAEQWNGTG